MKVHQLFSKLKHMTRKSHSEVMTSLSATDEHYTPESLIMMARLFLGVKYFDLDIANNSVNSTLANRSYTIDNSALREENSWASSSLWCNPPFSLNLAFSQKLVRELPRIEKAVWLSKCDCRPTWARLLLDNSVGMVLVKGYVRFNSSNNAPFGVIMHLFNDIDLGQVDRLCRQSKDYVLFKK